MYISTRSELTVNPCGIATLAIAQIEIQGTMMKPLIVLVAFCTALFITADVASLREYQFSLAETESDEAARLMTHLLSTVLSSVNEKIETGEIQSSNENVTAFKNLFTTSSQL